MQVALLGSITSNIRAIKAKFQESEIEIYYFFDQQPSKEEEELSEDVVTEVMCDYIDVSVSVHHIVIPEPSDIPNREEGIWVYFRWEKPLISP